MGNIGWLRSRAWIWLFSSTHNTTALSGGFRYRPTMSRTFSTKNGSVDSLKCRCRCGSSPNPCQMRCTVDLDNRVCFAICRTLQWVPSWGFVSSVLRTNWATRSSLTGRGRPGAQLVVQPGYILFQKPPSPPAHRSVAESQLAGNLLIGFSCRTQQNNPRPHDQTCRQGARVG